MNDVISIIDKQEGPFRIFPYKDSRGKKPVYEFLDSLNDKTIAKVVRVIGLIREHGPFLKRPFADKVEGDIYELRIHFSDSQIRILYAFFGKGNVVLLHGFRKKSNRIPNEELIKARHSLLDWKSRYDQGVIEL